MTHTSTEQPEALRLAEHLENFRSFPDDLASARELRRQHALIAELESKLAAAPQAVQAAVPEAIEQMAVDRYKVVPSHESMFHRWAVVAGNGTQQLYIGREGECQNMSRKFMGAFLDGAFVAMQNTAPAHHAEAVPVQLPEPLGVVVTTIGNYASVNAAPFVRKGDKLYTEQQVRDLLSAQHGIK